MMNTIKKEFIILFKFIKILLYSLIYPIYNEAGYSISCNTVYISYFSEYRSYWVEFFDIYTKYSIEPNPYSKEVKLYQLKLKLL